MPKLKFRTSLIISAIVLAGAVLELFKNGIIAYSYGSSDTTDVFFVSAFIPVTYAMFWISACSVGLVPVFSEWQTHSRQKFLTRVGQTFVLSLSLSLIVSIFLYFFSHKIIAGLALGFDAHQKIRPLPYFKT